jgi:hypothetical protein
MRKPECAASPRHAVFVRLCRIAFLNGHDVGAGVLVKLDHGGEAALARLHDHVRQKQGERLVSDQFARAPYRMAKPERHLLAGEAGLARSRLQLLQALQNLGFSALFQRVVELELNIEMILDHRLVASGDKDKMLDARFARFIDNILNDRPVHHRQHFLRNGLRSRKEARTQSRDREDCLSYFLHNLSVSLFSCHHRTEHSHGEIEEY